MGKYGEDSKLIYDLADQVGGCFGIFCRLFSKLRFMYQHGEDSKGQLRNDRLDGAKWEGV